MTAPDWLWGTADEVAPQLLGCVLRTEFDGQVTSVALTEVEAYEPDDPASHSHRGLTPRNRTMFERPGLLYVYRSYGIHWCCNVVTGPPDHGAAVLLRAGEPVEGRQIMAERRGRLPISRGPGRLCQALGITAEHDGLDLFESGPITLTPGRPVEWAATPRVGISQATGRMWRFVALDGDPPPSG